MNDYEKGTISIYKTKLNDFLMITYDVDLMIMNYAITSNVNLIIPHYLLTMNSDMIYASLIASYDT